MFARVFGGRPPAAEAPAIPKRVAGGSVDTLTTLEKLREAQRVLESRQALLKKKISDELARAQDAVRQKDKRGALQCLKRKAMYEKNLEVLENQALNLENQMNIIESAKAASEVASAMALGGAALKSIAKTTSVEAVDRVMDEIHEAADRMAEVQAALAQPAGGELLDEDELDAELAELEALEADSELLGAAGLPAAPTRAPGAPERLPSVPQGRPAPPPAQLSAEERELEELQAAMAA